jgi:hypothetical protein
MAISQTIDDRILRDRFACLQERCNRQEEMIRILGDMVSGEVDFMFDCKGNPVRRSKVGDKNGTKKKRGSTEPDDGLGS